MRTAPSYSDARAWRRWPARAGVLLAGSLILPLAVAAAASAGTLYLHSCNYPGHFLDAGGAFQEQGAGGFRATNACPQGQSLQIATIGGVGSAKWFTVAPPGIEIVYAYTPPNEVLVPPGIGSGNVTYANFFWSGGSQSIPATGNCCGGMDYGLGINSPIGPSSYFGWQAGCVAFIACGRAGQYLNVHAIELQAQEDRGPGLVAVGADNLFYQSARWVRGQWPATFQASDPSGVCATALSLGGQLVSGPGGVPNQGSWHQCPDQTWPITIDTTQHGQGSIPLSLGASNAAGVLSASPTSMVNIDNARVSVSLSGPTDAPSTAGTQYVTAIATAGPSGVAGFACSVDGGAYQAYPGASARIPVAGIGQHQVLCYASNNSFNVSGQRAASPPATWNLSIRQPAAITASFMRVSGLRCSRRSRRVYVPGRRVRRRRHGRLVYVRRHGHFRRVNALRCSTPHVNVRTSERVRFGHRATVSGFLGASDGTALGGQTVRVMTAPDNGSGHFTPAAVTITSGDGSWSARLRPGPSRLVEAVYGGTGTTEPATSQPIRVVVPASVAIAISPHRTHWGGTITIRGRLHGGYVPPAGELVVLRIGWSSGSTEIGHLYVGSDGRFRTKYTFLRGNGTVTYRLWAETAAESDYPYAPARSRGVSVKVGH